MKKFLGKFVPRAAKRDKDTRQAARYQVEEAVEFRSYPAKDGQDKVLGYGSLIDLSEGGVMFRFSGKIKVGQVLRMRSLQPDDSVLQFDPVVSVRWVEAGEADECIVGAECKATTKRRFSGFEEPHDAEVD